MTLEDAKSIARKAALARREAAHAAAGPIVTAKLLEVLDHHRGRTIAGYMPIRSEIDPMPVLADMARDSAICLPVIEAPARPLRFRQWSPGCEMERGTFGALVPAEGPWLVPEVLIVPLVAFDRQGGRLGYGGGFYDRTLAALRRAGPVTAIGFAFAAQEDAGLPQEATDEALDLVVTEREVLSGWR